MIPQVSWTASASAEPGGSRGHLRRALGAIFGGSQSPSGGACGGPDPELGAVPGVALASRSRSLRSTTRFGSPTCGRSPSQVCWRRAHHRCPSSSPSATPGVTHVDPDRDRALSVGIALAGEPLRPLLISHGARRRRGSRARTRAGTPDTSGSRSRLRPRLRGPVRRPGQRGRWAARGAHRPPARRLRHLARRSRGVRGPVRPRLPP